MSDRDLENLPANYDASAQNPSFVRLGKGMWKTSRLRLRAPQEDDFAFLQDMFSRPELTRHRPDPTPDDETASRERLTRDMAHWAEYGFGRWAVLQGGQRIGFGGVAQSQYYDGLNLFYHLHPDYWGHGYAIEIARAAVSFARDELRAPLIIGLARSVNAASQRVLVRAGLVYQREVMLHGALTGLFELRTGQ
ncbi:GNAT family N-acetyltransferase [Thalassospira profundimaris]|nr:GNAT family N-acetyltransferase [Thalassospira profundimaris]